MATGPTGLTVAFEHVVCPFFDGWVQRDTVGACSTRRPHSLHPSHRAQRDCKVRRDILWAPNQDLPLNPLLHDLLPHGLPLLLPLPPPAARVAAPSTVGSTWRQTTLPPLSWRSPSLGPCARTLTSCWRGTGCAGASPPRTRRHVPSLRRAIARAPCIALPSSLSL